ncbi:hypothetical protein Ddye_031675 [Dipteronia dyeriana]|uniref:DUF2828 domain-containing protein n=1 Tax=Dipteronia dyeriana TaxID=168575 RepID=A0AAD9TJB6_9ROSI|nr:hypothetical protein Ddye_031675 [Dipteronia dyeriana]
MLNLKLGHQLNPKNKFPSPFTLENKNGSAPQLLGPPELRRKAPQPLKPPPKPTDAAQPPPLQQQAPASSDPSMSYNNTNTNSEYPNDYLMTYTENLSPNFMSTGNPCLDFFFHVVPDTPPQSLKNRLQSAWAHDSQAGLKIEKAELARQRLETRQESSKTSLEKPKSVPRETRIAEAEKWSRDVQEKASELRKEKRMAMARKVLDRYSTDPDFKFLYERVSDYFADCLKKDMKSYESGKSNRVSFAAKWCPSLYSSYDLATLICESIANKVFPRENYPEYEEIEEDHYVYRVRRRLRKQVLVPLRKVLELPEVYMTANKSDLLPYNRVPSVAMEIYKDKFLKHDENDSINFLDK